MNRRTAIREVIAGLEQGPKEFVFTQLLLFSDDAVRAEEVILALTETWQRELLLWLLSFDHSRDVPLDPTSVFLDEADIRERIGNLRTAGLRTQATPAVVPLLRKIFTELITPAGANAPERLERIEPGLPMGAEFPV